MDLQAILDAPSSDEDSNDYLQRYTSSYYNRDGSNANNNSNLEEDIALSSTVSNLSNLSNVSRVKQTTSDILSSREQHQDEVMSGVSSGSPHNKLLAGRDDQENSDNMMDGANILRDLEEENDIVGQILRGSSSHGRTSSRTGANLELERILREADANDDDDEDDLNVDLGSGYNENRYNLSPARSAKSYSTTRSKQQQSSDLLLQSILNEADDDDDDEEGDVSSKKYAMSPTSGGSSYKQQFNTVESLAELSIGQSSGNSAGDIRRLSSLTQPQTATTYHAMEVDAILNSVADDDDDGSADLDLRNYTPQRRRMYSGMSTMSSVHRDDSDDDDNDLGLNLNYFGAAGSSIKGSLLQDVKYDDNISMQYPLSSRKESREQQQHEQTEIYVHKREGESLEQYSLKDYTANFLHGIGKQGKDHGNRDQTMATATITSGTSIQRSESKDEERLSTLCLQHAESSERKLLKPNTRHVVSPLTVKRRMKPKVELMTKSRMSQPTQGKQVHQSSHIIKQSQQSQQQPRFGFSGGIIQSKSMSTLGSQLLKSGGLPTALAVSSKFIAVGNQSGEVWVFDLFEQLKVILGGQNGSNEGVDGNTGSVTSIDLSLHGDFLLAGYGSGVVILWDIIKGSVLKQISDLHTSSISSARLTSVPTAGSSNDNEIGAVSVDASGLVNKIVFTRGRLWSSTYTFETECLLDGTAGQILAMDALPPLDMAQRNLDTSLEGGANCHPSVHKIVLIALSSGRSSFAVSCEPKVSVLHKWARPTTERIDPTISEEDRLTQVSSNYATSHVSSYASSYASSYMSTSTYQSNSTINPPKKTSNVDTTPVPYLPCLSWGWALVSGGGHSVTPILARAWGCCLQFLRASFPPVDEFDDYVEDDTIVHWPAFGTMDEFDASAPVVALEWLGKRSLVFLTITNEFIVIDTVIMTMQERLDFSGMKLVFAEFALSRSTRRQDKGGCTTFMNSIRSNDNRLLVLCQEEIKEITVLGMKQQIMSLEEGGQWLEALALALDHYESTIISQEDNRKCRRLDDMLLSDPSLLTEDEIWMAELLMRYLILAIDNAPESFPMEFSFSNSKLPNRLDLAESHFEMLSGVCIEFCIVTRRLDLLFGPIFRCFYEARYINVFLDVMETYILNDRLKYIAPEAMVLFVSHCKDMKDLTMVERCLLHMDCKLMDFDSILTLLKKNSLYTGLFHVYSNGLDDYISPLEILFDAVFESADAAEGMYADRRKDGRPSSKFEQYGYKVILYLQYCFKGNTFPKGNGIMPEDRIRTLRPELLNLLFQEIANQRTSYSQSHQSRNNSFRGIRALPYPYLRTLILTDAKAFLDCLEIVFDDSEARFAQAPSQTVGSYEVEYETDDTMTSILSTEEDANDDKELLPDRQHVVNILSSIIMSDSLVDSSSYQFGSRKQMTVLSIKAKHSFLDFLAKYLKLSVITAPKYLTGEVFIRLCNKRGASEDDILTLLHALPRSSYELDEVLYTAERVQMTRGALFLHKLGVSVSRDQDGMSQNGQHHFNSSIDCYLKDKDGKFKKGVFAYARNECSGGGVAMLRSVVLKRLPELVRLDAVHTAHLVGEIFVEEIDMILSSLKGIESGRIEYSFLHAIISGELGKLDTVAFQELTANLTTNHHHDYLLLMTRFQPDLVYKYLSSNHNYRLNDALKLCQERKITDASAYLLERMGDVSGALKLMLETLDTRMLTLKSVIHEGYSSNRMSSRFDPKSSLQQNETAQKEISRIKQILSAVLDLCERNKNDHLTLDNERGPLLWFHVLDRLVNAKSLLKVSKDSVEPISIAISTVLSELLLMTMQRMISNVSLYDLMQKITKDHAGSDLGEFREMLVSMLKTYSSELDVCSSAVDVMYNDIRHMSYEKKKLKVRGSIVQECPKDAPHRSLLEVGRAGISEVTTSHRVHGNRSIYTTGSSSVSLLQKRRRSERAQTRRSGRLGRRSGAKSLNLMTASENNFSPRSLEEMFGIRQVGALSEAQHVGGL